MPIGRTNRRVFILALSAAAAWPRVAGAQQGKMLRLGYLEPGKRTDPTVQNLRHQFLLGLRDLDYIENRDFKLEERYADGQLDQLPALAKELVQLPADIIAAGGEAAIRAAKQGTDQIPIVMLIAADPVISGFVATLARPGGNITGMSALASKYRASGWNSSSLTLAFRDQIGKFAMANRLPMMSELREFAVAGGLASYGTSRPDLWRRSAAYIDKIVRGANPAELPIEQPTRFELVINTKTAKALGIDLPPVMLTRADEVIE
jgi:ABC-type uncharacterized transport system substrate-binding protein